MNDTLTAEGIVLSAMPIGENDKRLVLLTREEGRITAFARGARRPRSSLLAAANPFVTGTFRLIPGRNSYRLISASVRDYFTELAGKFPEIYYGFYFLELTSWYTGEGIESLDTMNLLYLALKALLNPKLDARLVRRTFEIRLMTINGDYAPRNDLSGQAVYAVRYMMQAELPRVFQFRIPETVMQEIEKESDRALNRILDRELKSARFLDK